MNKIKTALAGTIAAAIVIGSSVALTQPAHAVLRDWRNWKYSGRSVIIHNEDGQTFVLKPGKNAYESGSKKAVRDFYVPTGCMIQLGTGGKAYYQGWRTLTDSQQFFGGTFVVVSSNKKPSDPTCNGTYR